VTEPFATQDDVETALVRPLTTTEANYIDGLIGQASALLRNEAPSIDDRIARYGVDPTDKSALSPATVAAVVAGVVKRYMVNPTGIASTSQTDGPFSLSTSYALRSEKETRGALQITRDDLLVLFPNRKRLRAGMIRTRPALAPRPVGRYGPIPRPSEAIGAAITFGRGLQPGEQLIDPFIGEEVGQ
jgi:hypothetical protein